MTLTGPLGFNLAPPSCYISKCLESLVKVSKVIWRSQPSYKILWSSFERNVWKDKLHPSKKNISQSPSPVRVKVWSGIETAIQILFLNWSFSSIRLHSKMHFMIFSPKLFCFFFQQLSLWRHCFNLVVVSNGLNARAFALKQWALLLYQMPC